MRAYVTERFRTQGVGHAYRKVYSYTLVISPLVRFMNFGESRIPLSEANQDL